MNACRMVCWLLSRLELAFGVGHRLRREKLGRVHRVDLANQHTRLEDVLTGYKIMEGHRERFTLTVLDECSPMQTSAMAPKMIYRVSWA